MITTTTLFDNVDDALRTMQYVKLIVVHKYDAHVGGDLMMDLGTRMIEMFINMAVGDGRGHAHNCYIYTCL